MRSYRMQDVPADNRQDIRLVLEGDDLVAQVQKTEAVQVCDISDGGLGFVSPVPFPVGQEIRISVNSHHPAVLKVRNCVPTKQALPNQHPTFRVGSCFLDDGALEPVSAQFIAAYIDKLVSDLD